MLAYILRIRLDLGVVFCLALDIHNSVENIIEDILLNVHDVKVMMDQIGKSVQKFSEDAALHPVMSSTKSPRFLLVK